MSTKEEAERRLRLALAAAQKAFIEIEKAGRETFHVMGSAKANNAIEGAYYAVEWACAQLESVIDSDKCDLDPRAAAAFLDRQKKESV